MIIAAKSFSRDVDVEKTMMNRCPFCKHKNLTIYFAGKLSSSGSVMGAWCQRCNTKAVFYNRELVPIDITIID